MAWCGIQTGVILLSAIAIIDSASPNSEEVLAVTDVLDAEMRAFCEAWRLSYWRVYHAHPTAHIPDTHFRHTLIDNSDKYPDWLGWHSSGGFFGAPNATTLTKDPWWAITADHEDKEMRGNPNVNIWRPWPGHPEWECAQETADMVQADWREITTSVYGKKHRVKISNYALPAWFEEGSEGPWDAFELCKGPGEIRPGGYLPIRNKNTGVRDNVWGRALPWWAKDRRAWVARKMQRLATGRAAMILQSP